MLIHPRAFCVRRAASKSDPTCLNLEAVHVESDGRSVATNGHLLAVFKPTPQCDAADFPAVEGVNTQAKITVPFSVSGEDAAKLEKAPVPKRPTVPILAYLACDPGVNGVAKFAAMDLESLSVIQAAKQEGEFPRWEKVVPKNQPQAYATVNLAYLKSIVEICEAACGRASHRAANMVTLSLYAPDQVLRFDVKGEEGELTCVLMPMRAGWLPDNIEAASAKDGAK